MREHARDEREQETRPARRCPTPQRATPAPATAPRPKKASGVAIDVIAIANPTIGLPDDREAFPRIGDAIAPTAIATANQIEIAGAPAM